MVKKVKPVKEAKPKKVVKAVAKTAKVKPKLTPQEKELLTLLHAAYESKGDIIFFTGDSETTQISNKTLMAGLSEDTRNIFNKLTEDLNDLFEKSGLSLESKLIIKLI